VPSLPEDSTVYSAVEGILVLDGIIDNSQISGDRVKIQALHKFSAARYTPRLNCSELSKVIPTAGAVFSWQNGKYILVSKI